MEFRLFGEATVVVGDDAGVALGGGRPAAVLALLLLEAGHVVPVDRLVESLWGEAATTRSVHAVRVYVGRLRSALAAAGADPRIVAARPGGYVVEVTRARVDVLAFEDLATRVVASGDEPGTLALGEEALSRWLGTPLADFPYEDWAMPVRRRLEALRLDVLEEWAGAALAAGRAGDVAAALGPEVEANGHREGLWVRFATALYQRHRQSEALAALRSARASLARAGLDPGPALSALESAILRHDPTVAPPGAAVPTNLPAPLDGFVGREQELATLLDRLGTRRLVTLTGPGGCGKTRLAVEASRRLTPRFPTGIWLVDLAAVAAPGDVASAVARTVGARDRPAVAPVDAIVARLGGRAALLLLDNCEHVVDAAAALAVDVLRACPRVRVLATSREPLRLPGESVLAVPSLAVPPVGAPTAELREAEAVELFVARTRDAAPGFRLDEDVAADVTAIVRVLDGIPLAIELAAVRVRSLPVGEIARRLDDVFGVLGVGPRTALPRHRTLAAALRWSTDVLDEPELDLFRRLGVLRSGFGLDAADAVAGDLGPALVERRLSALVERSLVVATASTGRPRYRLLEPVRQFAAGLLDDHGGTAEVEALRDAYYASLAIGLTRGERHWTDPELLRRFDHELPHLAVTIDALHERGDVQRAAAATAALGRFWAQRGLYAEGRRAVDRALAAGPSVSPPTRTRLLRDAVHLAMRDGDLGRAEELATGLLGSARAVGSPRALADASNALGSLAAVRRDMRTARRWLGRALAADVDDAGVVRVPATLNLAAVHAWAGRPDLAGRLVREARGTVDASWVARLATLAAGICARMSGEPAIALATLEAMLAERVEDLSGFHRGLAHAEAAEAALESGDLAAARRHCAVHLDGGVDVPATGSLAPRARVIVARVATIDGDLGAASRMLAATLDEATASGATGTVAECADAGGHLLLAAGESRAARLLLAASTAMRRTVELARDPWQQRQHDAALATLGTDDDPRRPPTDPAEVAALVRRHLAPAIAGPPAS